MVGQTCNECASGHNGRNTCALPDSMDEWSKDTPQPCGEPLASAPDYRHHYHARHSDSFRSTEGKP